MTDTTVGHLSGGNNWSPRISSAAFIEAASSSALLSAAFFGSPLEAFSTSPRSSGCRRTRSRNWRLSSRSSWSPSLPVRVWAAASMCSFALSALDSPPLGSVSVPLS